MNKIIIRPIIKREYLEKPYFKGIIFGIVMGMGIAKIIQDAIINHNIGVMIGFATLIMGIILAVNYGDSNG